MKREKEVMTLSQFKFVADKVKERGIPIGAMFCFGEPLSDPGLFDKIRYGKEIGVLTGYLGLNTNVSLLGRDKWDDILSCLNNITLSFFNIGPDFERLTGGLSYDQCYRNAIEFIKYRDEHNPRFKIEIGVNDVAGHNRDNVRKVFDGYDVNWARDAEIKWGGKVIVGPIDRSIMYHSWKCDGLKGALQIKPNGDCCFCAYDVIESETKFANIFEDDWDTIEKNFKAKWESGASLCLRCDFWHNYHQMIEGGWVRGPHVDDSWQKRYV